jgi:hypothetical protein
VKTLLRGIPEKIFKTVSGSGTIVSRSAQLHKENISNATAAATAQVSKFCFHKTIPGIKLSRQIYITCFFLHLALYYSVFTADGSFAFVIFTHYIASTPFSHVASSKQFTPSRTYRLSIYLLRISGLAPVFRPYSGVQTSDFRATVFHTILSLLHRRWRQHSPLKCFWHSTRRGTTYQTKAVFEKKEVIT